jgi:hypothetical protein
MTQQRLETTFSSRDSWFDILLPVIHADLRWTARNTHYESTEVSLQLQLVGLDVRLLPQLVLWESLGYFQVLDPPPLTSDIFDDCNLDPTIWTVYNPDPQNVHGSKIDGNHNEGCLKIYIAGGWAPNVFWPSQPELSIHCVYQHLRSPSEKYEVTV